MIIGIGGVSTAGKTSLANKIRSLYATRSVSIVCQDDFVKPVEDIPKILDRVDWEHPASIDNQRLIKIIEHESKKHDIVIAEGLMIFNEEKINALFDKRIFISIDYETFKQRKLDDNRWRNEPEWYIEHIWKSYLAFGSPFQKPDFLLLDGTKPFPDDQLLNFLEND